MRVSELFRTWEDIDEFRANSVLFSEKDAADAVYVILEGQVELRLRGKPLSVEGEGGVIGEMAMIDAAVRNATAKAKTRVRAARLSAEDFRRMMSRNPDFALHVMSNLANRLRSVDGYISKHLDGKD